MKALPETGRQAVIRDLYDVKDAVSPLKMIIRLVPKPRDKALEDQTETVNAAKAISDTEAVEKPATKGRKRLRSEP
ncbi:hypothetical protein GNI_225150, partial [Gregarina niphandrodes]